MDQKHIAFARRQLSAITVLLSFQFILGVSLTTIIDYDPKKRGSLQMTILILHIVVAFGLLAAAIVRMIQSIKWRTSIWPSAMGLTGIVLAMISGSIAATNGNDAAVFLMAIGFLMAFAGYGFSMSEFSRLKNKN